MNKFQHITTFIEVVEKNSFVAAGKKLGLSTAAISKQISNLEAKLNTQLLQRTTRQLKLTPIGTQYYAECKKVLQGLLDMETIIASNQIEPTGTLNIVSARFFATEYILPHLAKFMRQNPKLHINLEIAERFPDFNAENIDILFGVSLDGPPHLVRKRITTTRYILCASPAYLKKFGTPKMPSDLVHHRYITHSIRKPDDVLVFKNKEIFLKPILRLNDSIAMRECALKNIGIVKLHDYFVNDALKNNQLVEILKNYQEPSRAVYLYYQQDRYLLPKIRRFIDFFTEVNAKKK